MSFPPRTSFFPQLLDFFSSFFQSLLPVRGPGRCGVGGRPWVRCRDRERCCCVRLMQAIPFHYGLWVGFCCNLFAPLLVSLSPCQPSGGQTDESESVLWTFCGNLGRGAPYEESSSNWYCMAFIIGFLQRTTIVCTPLTIVRSMGRWVEERQVDERKFRIF